jgi:hypothetical protein
MTRKESGGEILTVPAGSPRGETTVHGTYFIWIKGRLCARQVLDAPIVGQAQQTP